MVLNFRSSETRKIYEREEENWRLRIPHEILLRKYGGDNFVVPEVAEKMVVKWKGNEWAKCAQLAQDKGQWRTVVNMVQNTVQ